MINNLPQIEEILTPSSTNPSDVINFINSHIDTTFCEKMSVDISFMNVIDACYVSTLCSTKHFMKYPNGKISWKISSEIIKDFNKDLELGNICYVL